MTKLLFIFSLLALVSCGTKNTSSTSSTRTGIPPTIQLGVTTEQEVEKELGGPIKTYTVEEKSEASTSNSSTMLSYENESTVKINSGVAKGYFRNPKGDEVHLQYWLQAWKDKKVTQEKIEGSADRHGHYDYQMINVEDRTTIVYNQESGTVKRVMYYEK